MSPPPPTRGQRQKQQQHHVFLLRHCVRSTALEVDLYEGEGPRNATDFTASPFPNWNAPVEGCTPEALTFVQNMGMDLLEHIVHQSENNNNNNNNSKRKIQSIKVQFISDVIQRDVDTSFALSQGIANAAKLPQFSSVRLDGLDELLYDPVLFSVFDATNYFPQDEQHQQQQPLCSTNFYSQERYRRDVQRRLDTIPPPSKNLSTVTRLLDETGGIGPAGPLTDTVPPLDDDDDDHLQKLVLSQDNFGNLKLQGAVNVVKLMAQMVFLSRAGGVDPPFLPTLSIQQVYELLTWVHWTRSVLSKHNVRAATEGSVLARAVLEVLEHGQYYRNNKNDKALSSSLWKDYDATVTFIVGHDENLDSLGSVLGVEWKVEPPYFQTHKTYSPTPPVTTMHLWTLNNGQDVQLSLLYPTFLTGHGMSSWNLVTNGTLRSTPLLFTDPNWHHHGEVITTDSVTRILGSGRTSGLDLLKERILRVLQENPGSMECYKALDARLGDDEAADLGRPSWSSLEILWSVGGFIAVTTLVVVLLLGSKRWRGFQLGHGKSRQEYEEISGTEMEP